MCSFVGDVAKNTCTIVVQGLTLISTNFSTSVDAQSGTFTETRNSSTELASISTKIFITINLRCMINMKGFSEQQCVLELSPKIELTKDTPQKNRLQKILHTACCTYLPAPFSPPLLFTPLSSHFPPFPSSSLFLLSPI